MFDYTLDTTTEHKITCFVYCLLTGLTRAQSTNITLLYYTDFWSLYSHREEMDLFISVVSVLIAHLCANLLVLL